MGTQAQWFRLYHDVLRDPKFDVPWWTDRHIWLWIGLLLLASESSKRGTITFYVPKSEVPEQLQKTLRSTLARDEIVTCLSHLEKTGCLHTVCSNPARTLLRVCHWRRRQEFKPSDDPEKAAERQRKSRARRREPTDVTPPVTPCHAMSRVSVTPPIPYHTKPDQSKAERAREETEAETPTTNDSHRRPAPCQEIVQQLAERMGTE